MKSPIQSLDVSYIMHATEDLDKVSSVVSTLIETEASPLVEEMTGHFGNSIRKVSFRLRGDEATASFAGVVSKLPHAVKTQLVNEIGQHLDEHSSLFLRLDKQRLMQGELAIGSEDAIRLKVKPRTFLMKGRGDEFFAGLLGGS